MTGTASVVSHKLRCTGCGRRIDGKDATSNFRCAVCAELYEVVYPWSANWNEDASGEAAGFRPNSGALKHLWSERKTSSLGVDQSGVWRFRDLLPIVQPEQVVTLREGNTPLYDLPKSAARLGLNWLLAKHQGMNPTGSFKDTGMTAALSVAVAQGYEWVACAFDGQHLRSDGGVCGARGAAQHGVDSRKAKLPGASCRSRWITGRRRCS